MRGLRSHSPDPEGDGGDRSGSAAARPADEAGDPARIPAARVLSTGGPAIAGLAGLATIGLLVGGCSAGGTGMRDEGPAVPAPVERTLPTPSATPTPTRAAADPLQLLQADPRVSVRVKGALKKCGTGSYPVSTSYGDLTGSSRPDLVVNVTTCKDSIGIATYVYRVADTPTASPSAGSKATTGGTAGGATGGTASGNRPAGTTGANPAGAVAPAAPGTSRTAAAPGTSATAAASADTADPADPAGSKAVTPHGAVPGDGDDGATASDGSTAGGAGPVFLADSGTRSGTARRARPLPGMYQNVFTAEEPSVFGTIDRGELVVTQQVYAKGDSVDLPSGEDVVTYDWTKSRFTERYHVRNTYGKSDADDGMGAPAPAPTVPKN